MKIVILTGSYNLHGTSNTLVDEFIKGAEENNNEIIRFDTAHLNIRPCIGCNHCGMDGDMACFPSDKYNLNGTGKSVFYLPVNEVQCITESLDR